MVNGPYFKACQIYSEPGSKGKPARPGLLPMSRAHFYRARRSGKLPEPLVIGGMEFWTREMLEGKK